MTIEKVTPQVGASGVFLLKVPYKNVIPGTDEDAPTDQRKYSCIAVRRFEDITGRNSNIKESYYDSVFSDQGSSFSKEEFDLQVAADVAIITLQDDTGNFYYVPDSYIDSVPTLLGRPYSNSYIAVKLLSHNLQLDLNPLAEEIRDLVRDRVGLEGTAYTIASRDVVYLDDSEHDAIEATRLSRIENNQSSSRQLDGLNNTIVRQREIIDQLQQELVDLRSDP